MTNADVVAQILEIFKQFFVFMAPIIGVLAGLNFVFTFLVSITFGLGRRTFKG